MAMAASVHSPWPLCPLSVQAAVSREWLTQLLLGYVDDSDPDRTQLIPADPSWHEP